MPPKEEISCPKPLTETAKFEDTIVETTERIFSLLYVLEEKLEPVLAQVASSESDDVKANEPVVPLLLTFTKVCNRTFTIEDRLNGLIDRIHI